MTGRMGACCTAGEKAAPAIRPASTITPISAAPRWRSTKRPATIVYSCQARDWVAILDRHYWDTAGGGYFFSADDTEALIARAKTAADVGAPAGNGTLVGVLTQALRS